MNTVTAAILGYVLISLGIGAWIARRIRTEDDYLVAGRRLGYPLGIATFFATWFGAETLIGAAGSIYDEGIAGGSADPFGYGLCLVFLGLFFAVPLWRLRMTTLGDLFRLRYSEGVERLAVVLMVPTSIFWAAAQIRAFGQVLAVSSGWQVSWTLTLAAIVVIVYTMLGGLLADAWTDLVQGIALLVGLAVLGLVLFSRADARRALELVDPERLSLTGPAGTPLLATVEAWAIPVCGSVLAAELVARVLGCRSATIARRSAIYAGAAYLVVGILPVAIGLAGPELMPELEHPEQLIPRLAQQLLSTPLFALFAGALVSAILSTVDSALLAAGSLVSHNLLGGWAGTDERQKVRMARATVLGAGIVAYWLALRADGVYHLIEQSSAFASAGIFTVIVAGLTTRIGSPLAAYASLTAGTVLWIAGDMIFDWPYPYLTSLAGAAGAYLLAALLFGNRRQTVA